MVEEGGSYLGEAGARVIFHFVTMGNLRYFDGDDNENVKKAIS